MDSFVDYDDDELIVSSSPVPRLTATPDRQKMKRLSQSILKASNCFDDAFPKRLSRPSSNKARLQRPPTGIRSNTDKSMNESFTLSAKTILPIPLSNSTPSSTTSAVNTSSVSILFEERDPSEISQLIRHELAATTPSQDHSNQIFQKHFFQDLSGWKDGRTGQDESWDSILNDGPSIAYLSCFEHAKKSTNTGQGDSKKSKSKLGSWETGPGGFSLQPKAAFRLNGKTDYGCDEDHPKAYALEMPNERGSSMGRTSRDTECMPKKSSEIPQCTADVEESLVNQEPDILMVSLRSETRPTPYLAAKMADIQAKERVIPCQPKIERLLEAVVSQQATKATSPPTPPPAPRPIPKTTKYDRLARAKLIFSAGLSQLSLAASIGQDSLTSSFGNAIVKSREDSSITITGLKYKGLRPASGHVTLPRIKSCNSASPSSRAQSGSSTRRASLHPTVRGFVSPVEVKPPPSTSIKKPEFEVPKWYGTTSQPGLNDTTRIVELIGKTQSASSRLCRSPRKLSGTGFTRLVMDSVPPENQGFVMATNHKSRGWKESEGHALALAIQSCGPPTKIPPCGPPTKQMVQRERGFREVMMAQGGVTNQKLETAVGSAVKMKTRSYWQMNAAAASVQL